MKIPDSLDLLIQKYLAGNASAEEEKVINDWYHSFNDTTAEIIATDGTEEAMISARIKEKIFAGINQKSIVKSFNKWWLSAAAIFLALLCTGIYLSLLSKKNNLTAKAPLQLSPSKNNIYPGSNKATLTLANGTFITLDSASNGVLSRQGGSKIVKLSSGRLVYNANKNLSSVGIILYNTISTPRGGQYQVTLSDNTKVWLNASSSIRFPTVFAGRERRVEITGEAYFEVSKNAATPFNVLVNGAVINVLGTHFNIMAYDNEASINTTLLEGSLQVVKGVATCLLKPGQQAALSKAGIINIIPDANLAEAVAWKNGLFEFNSTDVKTIMRQLERWYDVEVVFDTNVNLHFSGEIIRAANVTDVLKKLALTNEINFKIEGRKIIVSK